jgi:Protein of unknown function (DUF3303)
VNTVPCKTAVAFQPFPYLPDGLFNPIRFCLHSSISNAEGESSGYNRDAFRFPHVPHLNFNYGGSSAMKTMVTWSLKPGGLHEAARRFVSGEAGPQAGLTLLGRWHSVDMRIGFALFEGDDPVAHYASAAKWADVMDMKTHVVIEDSEAGPIIASLAKK